MGMVLRPAIGDLGPRLDDDQRHRDELQSLRQVFRVVDVNETAPVGDREAARR